MIFSNISTAGERQTLLFSATFPKEIQRLAADFMHDYIFLSVGRVGSSTDLIVQHVEYITPTEKRNVLLDLINTVEVSLSRILSCLAFTAQVAAPANLGINSLLERGVHALACQNVAFLVPPLPGTQSLIWTNKLDTKHCLLSLNPAKIPSPVGYTWILNLDHDNGKPEEKL